MKQYLLCSLITLAVALVTVVGVFLYVQYQLAQPTDMTTTTPSEDASNLSTSENDARAVPDDAQRAPTDTPVTPSVPAGGIPLSSLPLTDAQKSTLKTMNIDPETFVITQAMVNCTEAALGAARFAEIMNGAAPSFSESLTLFTCIK